MTFVHNCFGDSKLKTVFNTSDLFTSYGHESEGLQMVELCALFGPYNNKLG